MAGTKRDWSLPRRIIIYRDEATPSLDAHDVADYLVKELGIPATVKGDFLKCHHRGGTEELARKVAETRIRDTSRPFIETEPSYGEVAF